MKNLLNRALALICVVLMMISLFALPAFAEDGHEGHNHGETTTEQTTTEQTTTEQSDTLTQAQKDAERTRLIKTICWIVLGGVVVVGVVVLLIKCPEKIAKGLRVYKSEFKKVSWLSWKETKKSSLVVLGMLAACALVICLLDLGLYEGFVFLINKLSGLF